MLLKRAKRMLTSAQERPYSQTECRFNTTIMAINGSKSINIQSHTSCLLSQCLWTNKHLSDAAKHQSSYAHAKQADHTTEAKMFWTQWKQWFSHVTMTWTLVLELGQRIWMFGLWEPQKTTVCHRDNGVTSSMDHKDSGRHFAAKLMTLNTLFSHSLRLRPAPI